MEQIAVMMMNPIGVFHCGAQYPYDAARQPGAAFPNHGTVVLHAGCNYEQALQDLEGFTRIWLLYAFHHNPHWKPMVKPPRAQRKVGVFATRAPYRPNPIGLSCVELLAIRGLTVEVGAHDLLNGTPILDIKPYLAYADSFPEARCGWLEEMAEERWAVRFSDQALGALSWLEARSAISLRGFLVQQLSEHPLDIERKRVHRIDGDAWEIAYRTWRVDFVTKQTVREIVVERIRSGYSEVELENGADRHGDKELHRLFVGRTAELEGT